MNANSIQGLRYKLQKRVRRLNSAGFETFHSMLKQFWVFLQDSSVLKGILDDLERRCPSAGKDADLVLNRQGQIGDTELEHAAICYFVVKKCVDVTDIADAGQLPEVIAGIGYRVSANYDESLDSFRDALLEPLYEYIDEQLDDQRAILALLRRYKHRCEWFQRSRLYDLWQSDMQSGERSLAYDLYAYLYDQGLDFAIEPTSASGKPDLVSVQTGDERLIADAKVFTLDKGKSYIASAFNQVYQYTLDYNQPFGYLVIYKTCEEDLKLPLAEQEQSTPFLIHNNKTVFFLTVDICQYEKPASKRGKLKVIEITEADLLSEVS